MLSALFFQLGRIPFPVLAFDNHNGIALIIENNQVEKDSVLLVGVHAPRGDAATNI